MKSGREEQKWFCIPWLPGEGNQELSLTSLCNGTQGHCWLFSSTIKPKMGSREIQVKNVSSCLLKSAVGLQLDSCTESGLRVGCPHQVNSPLSSVPSLPASSWQSNPALTALPQGKVANCLVFPLARIELHLREITN